jgi:hypothetical protein
VVHFNRLKRLISSQPPQVTEQQAARPTSSAQANQSAQAAVQQSSQQQLHQQQQQQQQQQQKATNRPQPKPATLAQLPVNRQEPPESTEPLVTTRTGRTSRKPTHYQAGIRK